MTREPDFFKGGSNDGLSRLRMGPLCMQEEVYNGKR